MDELRKRLKESCHELYQALENSWQVALSGWLPMVDAAAALKSRVSDYTDLESFNSYPHLKNLENHLDRVILTYEQFHARKTQNQSYSMLSPVEIYVILASILFHDMGRIKDKKDHGTHTKEFLINQGRFAELGIPSLPLAKAVAKICEFHTKKDMSSLSTIAINPYGIIRCRELAALLLLIDEMDDTFNRVLRESLTQREELKAGFRRNVNDVYIDPERQTVFTVVESRDGEKDEINFRILQKVVGDKKEPLEKIKDELARLGIFINRWLLEYDEHLYDENGKEDYEACFYPGYLEKVVEHMWQLSTQIFGAASFTYENLAAYVRESNIEKIRIAVKRLSVIARELCKEEEQKNVGIWAGRDRWKWLMQYRRENKEKGVNQCCIYVSLKEIIDELSKIKSRKQQ